MVPDLTSAGKIPSDLGAFSLDALLAERLGAAARLSRLDDELKRRGVRVLSQQGAAMKVRPLMLAALAEGPATAHDIAERTGQKVNAAHQMLHKLTQLGVICRVGRGLYALPEAS